MLNKIKLLLGLQDNSKDLLLTLLIEQAIQEAVDITHNDSIAGNPIICDMVIYRYNQLGQSGLVSESYSGVSFHYLTDYPDNLYRQLKSYRKVRVV